ncbi:MAG: hypothetical protein J6Q83_04825 [Clostridia bacterium]|nr:hypothetical protein [Clostridia bacterium]
MKKGVLNRIKRPLAMVLVLCLLASVALLSGCSAIVQKSTVTVNDVAISEDVFIYFLDEATVRLGIASDYSDVEKVAMELVNRYFKTNSLARSEGIALNTAQKAEVSEKVNSTWVMYGDYYQNIGITRETLTKVFTAEKYREALMMKFYGKGGIQEISETRLYASFNVNYTVFQAITGYLTTTDGAGNKTAISKGEAETLILKFQNILNMVNSGEQTMEQAVEYLASTGVQSSVQTVVLHKDDTSYPEGFFQKIQTLQPRNATIISTNEYLFLVLRGETNMQSQFFEQMKPEMIMDIADDSIDGVIDGAYIVNNTINKETAESYFDIIRYEKSR